MDWVRQLTPAGGVWSETELRERALSAPELLDRAIDLIGVSATAWAVEVAARAAEQITEMERAGGFPTASSGQVRQASEVAFLRLLMAIVAGSGHEEYSTLTEDLLGIVRLGVRRGLPLDVLLNRVWAIHSVTRDQLIADLQHIVPEQQHAAVTRQASTAMLDYAKSHAYRVAIAYEEEQRAWRGWRTENQRRAINAVVEGADAPDPDTDPLDVHWSGGHAYAVAWFTEKSWIPDAEVAIADFAHSVADELGAERVIILEHERATQLWWNSPVSLSEEAAARIAGARRPEWLRLAVGPHGDGVEGFRDSVRGALLTERMARLPDAADWPVWRFDETGHLALLAADRDTAAWFVRHELGALGGPGVRLAEMRDTVRRYLASGNSRVLVAKELHLAPNTVAYRVGKANELLGRPVADRAHQVLLALQAAHALPGLLQSAAIGRDAPRG
ncbi:helix-turn-helix domain-containing protein [Microbacterium sp.]|uniref:helix-turn-helix domain-containing protein n=1 Tax=Microbacterium sp. TaxID=51671 RepID=UPI0037CA14C4